MKLKIKQHNSDKTFNQIKIKDRTKITLKSGIMVPTFLAMERMLNKMVELFEPERIEVIGK